VDWRSIGIWSAALAERLGKLQKLGEKESGLMAIHIPTLANIGHDITSRHKPVPNVANSL
jgi:hypothetical protein